MKKPLSTMRLFLMFAKDHYTLPLCTVASCFIFTVVHLLHRLPPESLIYALQLTFALFLTTYIILFARFLRRYKGLERGLHALENPEKWLPEPRDTIESNYQALLGEARHLLSEAEKSAAVDAQTQSDYYALWVHQIKTPIAAMRMLLSEEQTDRRQAERELFKIEQYAEMALQFSRLYSLASDLELKEHDLHALFKKAVRKLSPIFIHKKIALRMSEFTIPVITDEKWMLLIIEQLLSNSLKYTPPLGVIEISPLGQDVISIRDTGIGIRKEDLPRIFQRGFTGFNGRMDSRSTGIGLYLANETAKRLRVALTIDSTLGEGTCATIQLKQEEFSDYGAM